MQFFFYLTIQIHSSLNINTVAFTFLKVSRLIEQTLVKVLLCFYLINDARSHYAILIQVLSLVHFRVLNSESKLKKKRWPFEDDPLKNKFIYRFQNQESSKKSEKTYHSLSPSRLFDVQHSNSFLVCAQFSSVF